MEKQNFRIRCDIAKVDDGLGLVFGYAFVCKENGEPYVDTQDDYIPERAMVEAATDFALNSREARDSHGKMAKGTVPFLFPVTQDIADSLGWQVEKTGLAIGMYPEPDILEKFKSGEYTGFSIGGRRHQDVLVPEGEDFPDA